MLSNNVHCVLCQTVSIAHIGCVSYPNETSTECVHTHTQTWMASEILSIQWLEEVRTYVQWMTVTRIAVPAFKHLTCLCRQTYINNIPLTSHSSCRQWCCVLTEMLPVWCISCSQVFTLCQWPDVCCNEPTSASLFRFSHDAVQFCVQFYELCCWAGEGSA